MGHRRDFLKTTSLAGVGFWAAGGLAVKASTAANERVRIASIGVGGKGSSDTDQAGNHGDIVALCDIDDRTLGGKAQRFPKAKKYNDFRKLFDEMGNGIDAVTVSTADHTHAPASVMAMKLGKHVYCQKPLTHTVYEARLMRDLARKMKVCTQMGNQGSAADGLRRAVEVIQAGVLGQITEAHVWTNRPIWPQGADAMMQMPEIREAVIAALHGKSATIAALKSPPKHVHWDLFLGPAPLRSYAGERIYHPFAWRGWLDFGTGALGDMACHTANMAFRALKLSHPTSVVCTELQNANAETFPTGAKVTFQFPDRNGMGPVALTWYEGIDGARRKYLPTARLFHGQAPTDSGSLFVGEKGIIYSPDDYGARILFLGPNAKDLEAAAAKVSQSLPRNGRGDDGMKAEWIQAIKEGKPEIAYSNFDNAAPLTETILLGNIAMRVGRGVKLDWDGPNLKFTNDSKATEYVSKEYRKGWEL